MIGVQVKKMFVDRRIIRARVDRAKLKNLSRQGAFVRTAARSSIRKARMKKVGEMSTDERELYERRVDAAKRAGRPKPKRPRAASRPGEPPRSQVGTLRKFLFFSYDPRSESVVVGPARTPADDQDAPQTLEFGGTAERRGRRVSVAPRPYMGPALTQEQPKFAALWRNSVR